jgi:hypothetical protein
VARESFQPGHIDPWDLPIVRGPPDLARFRLVSVNRVSKPQHARSLNTWRLRLINTVAQGRLLIWSRDPEKKDRQMHTHGGQVHILGSTHLMKSADQLFPLTSDSRLQTLLGHTRWLNPARSGDYWRTCLARLARLFCSAPQSAVANRTKVPERNASIAELERLRL